MITATRYGFIEDLKICLDNGANLEYRIEVVTFNMYNSFNNIYDTYFKPVVYQSCAH